MRRRQEVRGTAGGVTVIDDFAHHPTATARTLEAIASRHPGARLLACFEPRSNTSRRSLHQREYVTAFPGAAAVYLLTPAPHDRVPEAERLDVGRLAREIAAGGQPARAFAAVEEMVEAVAAEARPGDVVVAMSNGAFGGIWEKLLARLGR